MKLLQNISIYTIIITVCIHCKKPKVVEMDNTRSFYMGTTPWPADFTVAEVDTAYNFINNHCDIVSHHFDDGIPYKEAFNNTVMPPNLLADIQTRKNKTNIGKKVMLSISALGLDRKSKAPYYNDLTIQDSVKNYWNQLNFDDPKVITSYVNYVDYLVNVFQPVFVNYGVESNALTWNPNEFLKYKTFIQQVFQQLKIKFPNIPFFISFIVDESAEGFTYASQLINYTDYIGLSSYPYITVSSSSNGNTDPANFPNNYYEKFINLANKEIVFAETGYAAQNLIIPSFNLNKQCNNNWQKSYLEKIILLCNQYKAKALIWFCSKDYDAGVNTLLSLNLYQDIFSLWKDTGLKDENGSPRPAYDLWLKWNNKVKK